MTHCKRGHELSVHGSEWKIYRNNWRHRRCMECFRINHDKGGVVKPHLVEKLKAHVLQGLPLRKAVIANQPLYIMPHNTMVAARRADPGLDRLIAAHLETRYERRLETIRAMVMPPTVPIYDNSAFFARFTDADFWKILEEVPRGLAPDKRQDVAQDVIEALLKGYIEPAGIRQHIKKYISAHYRENGSKWFAGGHLLSLDEMLCEGEIRRHDLVSEGLWS
jgi:hypothetical protein